MRHPWILVLAPALLSAPLLAQTNPKAPPVPMKRDSGWILNPQSTARVVHTETIRVPGAAWLRLYFGEVGLGPGSYLQITSSLDGDGWALVANLPYNVGTPIVLDVLRHVPAVTRVVVMVQAEVAGRFAAEPGSKTYGLPSVVVGLHAKVGERFDVPAQVFVPPPNVGSTVIVLDRVAAPPEAERAIELAAAGFGQRRKMLRASLKSVADDPVALCEAAGKYGAYPV